jgi:hypothetical protein
VIAPVHLVPGQLVPSTPLFTINNGCFIARRYRYRQAKRLIVSGLGFGGFRMARQTLADYETMAMIRKEQVRNIGGGNIRGQATFIAAMFQVTG